MNPIDHIYAPQRSFSWRKLAKSACSAEGVLYYFLALFVLVILKNAILG